MRNPMNYWSISSYLHTWTLHSIYTIHAYRIRKFRTFSRKLESENVAGLRIRAHLWDLLHLLKNIFPLTPALSTKTFSGWRNDVIFRESVQIPKKFLVLSSPYRW